MSCETMLICDRCKTTHQFSSGPGNRGSGGPSTIWCELTIIGTDCDGESDRDNDRCYDLCPACAHHVEELIKGDLVRAEKEIG